MKNPTKKQEEALREFLHEAVVPLIEDVLVKKLGQAMSYAKEQYKEPKREWVGLTDEEIEDTWGNTPMMLNARDGGARRVFARDIEAKLKEKNT
jgi:hypothetical protein